MPFTPPTAPRASRRAILGSVLLAAAMLAPASTIALSANAPATVREARVDDLRALSTHVIGNPVAAAGAVRREIAEWRALRPAPVLADTTRRSDLGLLDLASSASISPTTPAAAAPGPAAISHPAVPTAPRPAPKPVTKPAPPRPSPTPAPTHFAGNDHFWYPSLGIDRPLSPFPCSRAAAPGTPVYRWGCAGANNVYLLAHAFSWFKPLNQAYYAHGLQRGQLVVYADHAGRVHYYRLDYWKVGLPTGGQHWAWDPQPRSVLTLQTCVGANSQYRLFVRFHEVARP